jgi:hypothetical protein
VHDGFRMQLSQANAFCALGLRDLAQRYLGSAERIQKLIWSLFALYFPDQKGREGLKVAALPKVLQA